MMKRDRGRKPRRKVCSFCVDKVDHIDYKEAAPLHDRAREDSSAPHFWKLCKAPASGNARNQTGTQYRASSVHCRVRRSMPHLYRCGFLLEKMKTGYVFIQAVRSSIGLLR